MRSAAAAAMVARWTSAVRSSRSSSRRRSHCAASFAAAIRSRAVSKVGCRWPPQSKRVSPRKPGAQAVSSAAERTALCGGRPAPRSRSRPPRSAVGLAGLPRERGRVPLPNPSPLRDGVPSAERMRSSRSRDPLLVSRPLGRRRAVLPSAFHRSDAKGTGATTYAHEWGPLNLAPGLRPACVECWYCDVQTGEWPGRGGMRRPQELRGFRTMKRFAGIAVAMLLAVLTMAPAAPASTGDDFPCVLGKVSVSLFFPSC
jgi:hypothetical protein